MKRYNLPICGLLLWSVALSGCSVLNGYASHFAHTSCDTLNEDCSAAAQLAKLHAGQPVSPLYTDPAALPILEHMRTIQPAQISPYAGGPAYPVLSPYLGTPSPAPQPRTPAFALPE